MRKSKFPTGWDEERVRRVIAHEQQTEEEAVAEDEAAFEVGNEAVVNVRMNCCLKSGS